jgi:hypothetical protein
MGGSVSACFAPAEVKTLDSVRASAETGAHAIDVGALLREAIDRFGHKHEWVAGLAGYKADYWSNVLISERGIRLSRLGVLPLDVQRELVRAWASALGLRIERRDSAAQQARHRAALEALVAAAQALAEV